MVLSAGHDEHVKLVPQSEHVGAVVTGAMEKAWFKMPSFTSLL